MRQMTCSTAALYESHVTRQVSGAVVSTLSWCGVRVPDAPTLRDRERGSHGAWLQGMRQANTICTAAGVGDAVMGWTNKRRWYRSGGAGVAGKLSNWWPNTKPAA